MRIEQLKNALNERIEPIYLISGNDGYFCELAVKTLVKKCVTSPELNFASFDGKYALANRNEIVMGLLQYPFMSEKRLIVLREFYPTAKDLKGSKFEEYFKKPADTAVLAIVNSLPCDALKKCAGMCFVDCGKADEAVLLKYISVTFKRAGLIITTANARLLCEFCKSEMTRISVEVEKLCAYCQGEVEVTEADIRALVTKEQEYQLYELTEKVARKRFDEAYAIVSELQAANNDTMRLFSALYNYFRRLFFCATAQRRDAKLANLLGVKEYAITKSCEQAKRFTPKRLKQIVDIFTRYDAAFKSGQVSIDSAFSVCLAEIMS